MSPVKCTGTKSFASLAKTSLRVVWFWWMASDFLSKLFYNLTLTGFWLNLRACIRIVKCYGSLKLVLISKLHDYDKKLAQFWRKLTTVPPSPTHTQTKSFWHVVKFDRKASEKILKIWQITQKKNSKNKFPSFDLDFQNQILLWAFLQVK